MELGPCFVFLSCCCLALARFYPGPKDCIKGADSVGNFFQIQSGGTEKTMLWPEATVKTVLTLDTGTGSRGEPINGLSNYVSTCCGCVYRWAIDVGRPDGWNIRGKEVRMQFWRPAGTDNYRLTGEEIYTIPTSTRYYYPVSDYPSVTKVCVQVGDILGFTGNYLEWKTSNGYEAKFGGTVMAADNINPAMDSEHVINTEITEAQGLKMVGFALGAWFEPRTSNPSCQLNLLNGGSYADDTALGTIIGNVLLVTAGDPSITKHFLTLEDTSGLKGISIDPDSGKINVTGSLSVTPPSQDFLLTGRVTEDICYRYGDCQSTLTITWNNKPITITNSPGNNTLKESVDTATPIFTAETADDNRLENLDLNPTCNVTSVTPPNGGGFSMIKHQWISTQWVLQFDGTPALNSLISPVTVRYTCYDEYGSSDTGVFTLTVEQNIAPTVANPVDTATNCILVSAIAQTIGNKDPVVYFGPIDLEGDTIITKLTKKNASSPFAWDSANYEIYATQDLATLLHPYHEFTLQLWDKWSVSRPTEYKVCLTVTGLNSMPIFSNCPITEPITENQVAGALVTTTGVTDANKDRDKQIHTFTWTVTPSAFQASFTLNRNTGEITSNGKGLANDFEKADKMLNGGCINIVVSVHDGIHTAAQDCIICIKILNANDPPVFDVKSQTVEVCEQSAPGIFPPINTKFVDEDDPDTHNMRIISGNAQGFVAINATTGQLSWAKDCDYENGCPPEINLVIEVEDAGKLTSRTKVLLKVCDKNDNAPTFGAITCSFEINGTTSTNQALATVTATDADSGSNGRITYAIVGIGFGAKYFRIDSFGVIRLRVPINHKDGIEYVITVRAKDGGTPSLEGYVHCNVKFPKATVEDDDMTKDPPCFFCTGKGIAMFTVGMTILGLVLIYCAHLLNKYFLHGAIGRWFDQMFNPRKPHGIKQKPPRQPPRQPSPRPRPPPPQPKEVNVQQFKHHIEPPKPAPQQKFNFWNEGDKELHNKNPEPSNTTSYI